MTRALDRAAARREARNRRAELALFAAARSHANAVDQSARLAMMDSEGPDATATLAALEAAAFRYAHVVPLARGRRRKRR